MSDQVSRRVLAGLNPEQQAAACAPGGPLLIVAGAGTGKTTTLTARIAYRVASGQVPAGQVVAVTHSTRAAGALSAALDRYRMATLGQVATRTIHAAALAQLTTASARGLVPVPVVAGDPVPVVAAIAQAMRTGWTRAQVAKVAAAIAWAKSSLLSAHQVPPGRSGVGVDVFAEVFARYQEALARRGELDHTDLLTGATALLTGNPDVAEEVRRRARFLLVDEYQDTDPAQQALIDAWAGPDLTVVGDPRQAIYAFKGADPRLIETFPARTGADVVTLRVNYRSSAALVAAGNAIGGNAMVAHTPGGTGPLLVGTAGPDAELAYVVDAVAGTSGEVAVLVRDNARARQVADALTARRVPVWLAGTTRFFDLPEIATVRARMRALAPGTSLPGLALLRQVLSDTGFDPGAPPATEAGLRVWQSRAALLKWAGDRPAPELLGAGELVSLLEDAASRGLHVSAHPVTVGTIHAVKGLEFDTVFSMGWDHTWGTGGQDLNLAYVAVTRARSALALTWAGTPSTLLEPLACLGPARTVGT